MANADTTSIFAHRMELNGLRIHATLLARTSSATSVFFW